MLQFGECHMTARIKDEPLHSPPTLSPLPRNLYLSVQGSATNYTEFLQKQRTSLSHIMIKPPAFASVDWTRTVVLYLLLSATSAVCVLHDGTFSMELDPWLVNATVPVLSRKQAQAQRASDVNDALRELASLARSTVTLAEQPMILLSCHFRSAFKYLGYDFEASPTIAVLSSCALWLAVYAYRIKRRCDTRARQLAQASPVYELFDNLMAPRYDAQFWAEHPYMAAPRRADFPTSYKEPTTFGEKLVAVVIKLRMFLLGG